MVRVSDGMIGPVIGAAALVWAALATTPALADVRDGVDAWSRGDYAAAVAEWEGPAASGDADAMFNLGQAYRQGRGVAQDAVRAAQLYHAAAQRGHVQAADTYGLMLFQDGRREEALPLVQDSARRGDPRAQYLLGVAHFNGDLVQRDWVRAYALLTLANSSGLPQAVPAIAQMDEQIPLADRQLAAGLAEQLRAEAESARNAEFAAADLAAVSGPVTEVLARDRPYRVAGATLRSPAPQPVSVPAPSAQPSGPWRVQLGAFSVRANAERLWDSVSGRAELAGHERLLVPAGNVVRLLAGGFASQAQAQAACSALKRGGHDCLVTRN